MLKFGKQRYEDSKAFPHALIDTCKEKKNKQKTNNPAIYKTVKTEPFSL